jgi:hypothetical protein
VEVDRRWRALRVCVEGAQGRRNVEDRSAVVEQGADRLGDGDGAEDVDGVGGFEGGADDPRAG